jgi:structural maintenance of chromosome 4
MSTRPTRRAAAKRKQIIESDDEDEIANSPSPPPADEDDSEEDFTPAPAKSSRKSTGSRRKTIQADTPPVSEAAPRRRAGRPRKSVAPSVAPDTSVEPGESSQVADADQTITPTNSATRKRGRPKKQAIKQESVEPEASVQPSIEPANEPDETVEPVPENAEPDQTAMDVDQEETPVKKPARKRKSVAPPASSSKEAPAPDVQQPPPTPATPRLPKPSATPDPESFQTPLSDITNTAGNDQRRPIEDTLLNTGVKPIKALDTVMEKPMDIVLKSRTMVLPQVEDSTPKPRLVITYLILTNFKSYSGRQEVGPFHASFSSVVGPNGSGKSNVIDSLLFVFGFRASKMRQGKLSALIHNSADHPNLDFCEVAVHFQEVMDQV